MYYFLLIEKEIISLLPIGSIYFLGGSLNEMMHSFDDVKYAILS